ncbi:MAG: UDP-N-acetylglucosamine 2-epimerase (non-hydrolyzing) [Bacteroidetes bacterium]|nr:UDP-N-acetylglucosamine 2-epimerase (non-hydrolyzing) [Bacteroidota bacterium]HET6243816.1 UDP-N-acetylglucosamine 2-epimerase (non-hydrolyzing) [Bacteroidia bacterium]
MDKALLAIGTRPELIKVAPVIREMEKRGLRGQLIVVNTGQHKELMKNTFRILGIDADYTLDLMIPGQSLNELTARALVQFQQLIDELQVKNEKPAIFLAQGDTATAFAASVTAFHNKIPFAHIEAGLRTNNLENPFPEEYYRKIISLNTMKHFTPTISASNNLLTEGINPENIIMTGNTVVDAIEYIKKVQLMDEVAKDLKLPMHYLKQQKNLVLITCHRRENFGANMENIIKAIGELAHENPGHNFVWLRHPNPSVQKSLELAKIGEQANVAIIDPLDYFDLVSIYPFIKIMITDSGGLQEEAPTFKIPVIILRETTERMESVQNGFAFLCGANREKIKNAFQGCVLKPVNITHNPYGDGKASNRIADFLQDFLKPEIKIIIQKEGYEELHAKV